MGKYTSVGDAPDFYGIPKVTLEISAADTSAGTADSDGPSDISAVQRRGPGNHEPVYALLECKDNPITYTFGGVEPTNNGGTDFGHHLPVGAVLELYGEDAIKSFRFCNTIAGSTGKLVCSFCH